MRGRPGFDRQKRVGQFDVGYVFFFHNSAIGGNAELVTVWNLT